MCGIAGVFHFHADREVDPVLLEKMTNQLSHRGPDGKGQYISNGVGFGHRRLAILDLESGSQPMISADNNLVVVYNGEIYNYIELRTELQGIGYSFITTSDTEVLLYAYQHWGRDCLAKFNGMFAFALFDKKARTLFCARDRLGEKPFFFAQTRDSFVFASEPKALFAFGINREISMELLDAYLCFGYVPAPLTMFRDVRELAPGHYVTVKSTGLKVEKYWDLPLHQEQAQSPAVIAEKFESLLVDSVRLRLRSDVPLGAFLSGGLDSSSIVSAMRTCAQGTLRTFTIGFDRASTDERELARLVANRFNTDHFERVVDFDDVENTWSRLAWHFDEPFGDTSALPVFIISRVAREHVRVVLTGDGGDEVLSGYTIHQGERFASHYALLPRRMQEFGVPWALRTLRKCPPISQSQTLGRASRVVESAGMDFIGRVENKQSGFNKHERSLLLGHLKGIRPAREFIEETIKPACDLDNFKKLDYWLLKASLPDNMLTKVDRASMAHGLETRVPFLDHRLVELLFPLDIDMKLNWYQRKTILRRTIGMSLPRQILHAPKRGFAAPLKDWMGRGLLPVLQNRIKRAVTVGLIPETIIETLIQNQVAAKRELSGPLWMLAMLGQAFN
jgi:asparagine synthase (glutamine-hydrolysing)